MMKITKEEILTLLEIMEENKANTVELDVDTDGKWIDFDIYDSNGISFIKTALTIEK